MEINPQPNDRDGYTVGEFDHYYVDLCPMLFGNWRLVVTPMECTDIYDAGWCYGSYTAAIIACYVWEPAVCAEPIGYIKRVGFTDEWVRERAEKVKNG